MKVKVEISPDDFEDIFGDLFGGTEESLPEATPNNVLADRDNHRTLPCGHRDWYTEEEHALAQSEGLCCMGAKRKASRDYRVGASIPVKLQYDPTRKGYKGYPINNQSKE